MWPWQVAALAKSGVGTAKDANGEFLWTDLLEKRAGKWQVVRSAGYRIK